MDHYFDPVEPVSPPAPYLGGKRNLASLIIQRIAEVPHRTYAEAFIGMGGIFFRRDRRPGAEIINDRNGEVVNLFRVLQRHYPALMDYLKFQLTSRREFERLAKTEPSTLTDLERAGRFLYLQRTAYGGKITGQSFGTALERSARFDYTQIGPALESVYERLSGVTIENLDWADILTRYDSPDTLFYLDPPYWGCERDYGRELFSREQFALMAKTMAEVKGKVIVSLNDVTSVRQTFERFRIETVETTYTISQASAAPKAVSEVLIYNFDKPALPLFG